MNNIHRNHKRRFSAESLVLGTVSIISGLILFILMPLKPFGPNIFDATDPQRQFLTYAFMLFLLLLFGTTAAGTSVAAIVTGIKDYWGIDRGLYIDSRRRIHALGLALGITGLFLLAGILILWAVF